MIGSPFEPHLYTHAGPRCAVSEAHLPVLQDPWLQDHCHGGIIQECRGDQGDCRVSGRAGVGCGLGGVG